jgi:MoaA/NifB/PqqE/SkfB family radical SAM enzyme
VIEGRSRTTVVRLAAACDQRCSPCDCRGTPSPAGADGVPDAVRAGGIRLEIRGEPARDAAFGATLAAAAAAGWSEVWIRTNGRAFVPPHAAEDLAGRGVLGAILPIFSHLAQVHDAVACRPGALFDAMLAMRSLAGAGLRLAVEVPLLPVSLQQVDRIVPFARSVTGVLAEVRFRVPGRVHPRLAPPRWSEVAAPLAAALAHGRDRGIGVELGVASGIPLCALGHDPRWRMFHRFDPRRPLEPRGGFRHGAACAGCAMRPHCVGSSEAYLAAHGEADLAPFREIPPEMLDQSDDVKRPWAPLGTDAGENLILRPSLACNQDCPFCGAREHGGDVLAGPERVEPEIERAARRGVRHVSFGGGEPTLSPDLPRYVSAAKRAGMTEIEVVTNGVELEAAARVRELCEAGLTQASVSLHGHDDAVASRSTRRPGDFARSVRAVHHLLDAGIPTTLSHVVSALNFAHLPEFAAFVAEEFGTRVTVSFGLVTPQRRQLSSSASLLPRLAELVPPLRDAMAALLERGVLFKVGSRQGVPPCVLGEFAPWSDVFRTPAGVQGELQKVQGPRCGACRYVRQCTGVWRLYADRYGLEELVPLEGPPFAADEVDAIRRMPFPPAGLDEVSTALRNAP